MWIRYSYIISICLASRVYAFDDTSHLTNNHIYTINEMTNITVEAITKRDDARLLMKNFENWFNDSCDKIGIGPEVLIPISTAGAALVSHKITTRGLHMYYSPKKDLTIRPDVDYYLSGGYSVQLTANWRF